jgi:RHS repeat-associated protein
LKSADTSSNSCPNGSAGYQYAYDANGNMTTKTIGGVTTSYGYNTANELTTVNGATAYSYDSEGNATTSPSLSALTYNAKNQTSSTTPLGGSAIAMTYSGPTQGLRVGAGGTSYTNSLLFGLTSETTGTATTSYIRTPGGDLTERRSSSGSYYYYLYDGLGSVVAVIDSSGGFADRYKYDPYGNLAASNISVADPWRYAGYYYDSATGLYKVGLRYYDLTVGRWTQRDPIDDPLEEHGWNRYVYAADDPINTTDPSGTYVVFYWRGGELVFSALAVSSFESPSQDILAVSQVAPADRSRGGSLTTMPADPAGSVGTAPGSAGEEAFGGGSEAGAVPRKAEEHHRRCADPAALI